MYTKQYYYGVEEDCYGLFRKPTYISHPDTLLVFIHGGFWREKVTLEYLSPLASAATERGFCTWQIEYKRVMAEHTASNILDSVCEAINYCEQLKIQEQLETKKVVLIGHSVGAQLATYFAKNQMLETCDVSSLILLAGVLDFQTMEAVHKSKEQMKHINENPIYDFLREEYTTLAQQLSPIEQLPLEIPQVLIHGNMDIEVPIGLSQNYYQKARALSEPITFIEAQGGEHYWIVDIKTSHGEKVLEQIIDTASKI